MSGPTFRTRHGESRAIAKRICGECELDLPSRPLAPTEMNLGHAPTDGRPAAKLTELGDAQRSPEPQKVRASLSY